MTGTQVDLEFGVQPAVPILAERDLRRVFSAGLFTGTTHEKPSALPHRNTPEATSSPLGPMIWFTD